MKIHTLVSFGISTIIFLFACSQPQTTLSLVNEQRHVPSEEVLVKAVGVNAPLAAPSATAAIDSLTMAPTITHIEKRPKSENLWRTYTDPHGFMFEYPRDWELYPVVSGLVIRSPLTQTSMLDEGISLSFGYYSDNRKEEMRPDFQYSIPNEGGMERHWADTFPVADGVGLLYVWGNYDVYPPDREGFTRSEGYLHIKFYNERYQAVAGLMASFSNEDANLASSIGIKAIVEQKYPNIQHIIETFRFLPPLATPTPIPQVQQ